MTEGGGSLGAPAMAEDKSTFARSAGLTKMFLVFLFLPGDVGRPPDRLLRAQAGGSQPAWWAGTANAVGGGVPSSSNAQGVTAYPSASSNQSESMYLARGAAKSYGGKRVISHSKHMIKKKRKDGKYIKWQYNQVVAVLSPIFTKTMFRMANTRSTMIGVLFLQFSQRHQSIRVI